MAKYKLLILLCFILSACQTLPDVKTNYHQAIEAYNQKNWKVAEPLLLKLTKETPSDAQIWFKLANIYARDNKVKKAIKNYQEALLRDPKNPKIWHNLGVIHLRQATLSFYRVTEYTNKQDPLSIRSSKILNLYDQTQQIGTD